MDVYPTDYVVHNLPLILFSGLESQDQSDNVTGDKTRTYLKEGGFRIRAELPPVQGNLAVILKQSLLQHDSTQSVWHARPIEKGGQRHAFNIRSVGRTYALPPRKAPPPAHSPRLRPADNNVSPSPLVIHSTLSPLSPSSPVYPDGLITPLWVTKHQSRLPSVFVSVYTLTADANTSSLLDNKIRSEVNQTRITLTSTNYKTRLAVVLLGDGPIRQSDLEDRLVHMRRNASLDAKTLFYLPHDASKEQVSAFVDSLLSTVHPTCVEHYRDLSKHARRKRNRSTIPPPTVQPGTSSILTSQGWNVRYEFKLGVFAEFRQEMEAACRNYESAYEALFGPEVFEAIPVRSSRFNETRLLSDIIAIRIIRCLLWSSQTSAAVQMWIGHRSRIRDLIDRREKGFENYAWEAWQTVWSKTMADLIGRSGILPATDTESDPTNVQAIFAGPDKTLPVGERIMPWDHLHHQGYWLNIAQRYTQNRRARALELTDEDRARPDSPPSSTNMKSAIAQETYLAPQPFQELPNDGNPGFDYMTEICKTLDDAIEQFSSRGQTRMAHVLELKKAAEYLRSASWSEAASNLKTLWSKNSWREAGWWLLLVELGQALIKCATEMEDYDSVAQIVSELSNLPDQSTTDLRAIGSEHGDYPTESTTSVDLNSNISLLHPHLCFAHAEGHVGEPIQAQLSLMPVEGVDDDPIEVTELRVIFEGGLRPVLLRSEGRPTSVETKGIDRMIDLKLYEHSTGVDDKENDSKGPQTMQWEARTEFPLSRCNTTVFNLGLVPREPGIVSVASITTLLSKKGQKMALTLSNFEDVPSLWWETKNGHPRSRQIGKQRHATSITVLPKPPKVDVSILNPSKIFYTNEEVVLDIQIRNQEESTVKAVFDSRLISPHQTEVKISWLDRDGESRAIENEAGEHVQALPKLDLGELASGTSKNCSAKLSGLSEALDHELELAVSYFVASDPGTPLTKLVAIEIPVVRPFEANTLFHPRIHEEDWPSFFSPSPTTSTSVEASGLKQQYLITATMASFAQDPLEIQSLIFVSKKIVGGATAVSSTGRLKTPQASDSADTLLTILPEHTKQFEFDLTIQKLGLGDRQPVAADFVIEVKWRRSGTETMNTSVLAIPRFLAPISEPRVLLRASKVDELNGVYNLVYTIENPSMHFLTFNIAMESGEDFAFSGTKSKTISLVPISRYDLTYQILLYKSNEWVKVHLEVLDAYFGQTLKIQPACDGVKVDKHGNVLIWID